MSSITGSFDRSETFNNVHDHASSFANILTGENAFYKADDYLESTKRDFSVSMTMPATYVWNTQSKVIRVAKEIFAIIVFPVFIYNVVHSLVGKYAGLLPASSLSLMGLPANYADSSRLSIDLESEWKYKRLTVEVDGYQVDAVVTGRASTFGNGKWVLDSNGNGEFYEDKLKKHEYKQFLADMDSNGIVFNYPGVGASSGSPNRFAMAKAYRAILSFLENEIKAKQIVGKGFSIGGGVQGDALNGYALKESVKYVFIKIKTFSDLASAASYLTLPILGFFVKLLGWNMGSVESSKNLKAPEIIIQTASVFSTQEVNDASFISGDGVIAYEASLAKALLEDDSCPRDNKTFFGVTSDHNIPIYDTKFLIKKVKEYLLQS